MKDLEKNQDNIFRYISSQQDELPDIWDKIISKVTKLVPFQDLLKAIGGTIFEGIRARSHMMEAPIGSLFILHDVERANKREDRWILKEEQKRFITAENLITHKRINIPRKSIHFGLRRLSGSNTIELSKKT